MCFRWRGTLSLRRREARTAGGRGPAWQLWGFRWCLSKGSESTTPSSTTFLEECRPFWEGWLLWWRFLWWLRWPGNVPGWWLMFLWYPGFLFLLLLLYIWLGRLLRGNFLRFLWGLASTFPTLTPWPAKYVVETVLCDVQWLVSNNYYS